MPDQAMRHGKTLTTSKWLYGTDGIWQAQDLTFAIKGITKWRDT
jgi:hypothetical protein